MRDPREAKLPKWARDLLHDERYAAREAERKLNDHLRTVDKTRVWYGDYNNPVYVPNRHGYQRVHFDLGGEGRMRDEIQVGLTLDEVPRLEIMGGGGLLIEPAVSNHFYVRNKSD